MMEDTVCLSWVAGLSDILDMRPVTKDKFLPRFWKLETSF